MLVTESHSIYAQGEGWGKVWMNYVNTGWYSQRVTFTSFLLWDVGVWGTGKKLESLFHFSRNKSNSNTKPPRHCCSLSKVDLNAPCEIINSNTASAWRKDSEALRLNVTKATQPVRLTVLIPNSHTPVYLIACLEILSPPSIVQVHISPISVAIKKPLPSIPAFPSPAKPPEYPSFSESGSHRAARLGPLFPAGVAST